jgi:hypothetical protein
MKLHRFAVVQTQGLGYLRQVECEFAPDHSSSDERTREHITFRVGIEFEDNPSLDECVRAALLEVRRIVAAELGETTVG